MMTTIGKYFLAGLAAVLPILITVAILVWLGSLAESALGGMIRFIVPPQYYVPGLGVVAGLGLILAVGVLLQAYMVRSLFDWGEALLARIPMVKTIYGAVKDFTNFMSASGRSQFNTVVLVEMAGVPGKLIGFITRQDFEGLPDAMADDDTVAVYLPFSYQIGGYTLLMPRSAVQPLDMSMEDAMRFAVTAGMSVRKTADD
jgi:uncharacterized membrane protein